MLYYQMSSDPPGGSQGFGARRTWIDIGSATSYLCRGAIYQPP